MDYKVLVKEESLWASEEEIENVPSVIKTEYSYLKEAVFNDDVCGALFRLKDIYEICMKIPAIMAIISISSYVESDNDFIRMSNEQLKQEYERYLENDSSVFEESEVFKKFGEILSNLLIKPLSIGSWRSLIKIIVENSTVFELEEKLQFILSKTIKLLENTHPKKVGSQNGHYDNVENWRNKTIGHGTLLINTEQYWEQVYDLVKGLYIYFIGDTGESPLSSLYESIQIVQDGNDFILQVGEKRLPVSEYVYKLDEEQFFFDSYFSKQNYTEVTNYFSTSKRLKNSTYFHELFSLVSAAEKRGGKKKRRLITNSADREMYACLNNVPKYEKPGFIIREIRDFLKENSKGVMYIQMERGMGKSVLAHGLDGRYQNGILQKDLNAVTRVYHISDMHLRGERRTSDFFTALNSNLLSYDGKNLEIDNEDYINDGGKDVRHLDQMESGEAQSAFSYYLELFREKYDELFGEDEGEEIKLVYIIDGIDELNSDTESILDVIPSHSGLRDNEDVDHVYIILLSRTKEEEQLPEVTKRCIDVAEEKAGMIFKVDSENKEYLSLLRKFVIDNYKSVPEEKVAEIIDYAERKFLYIKPYMAFGNKVFVGNEKNSAYSVAQKYVEELQKLYCGTSLHTLQLVIAAIAVFHSVSLKELCDLVLFTKVSYDVIGILNDILPLLSARRTDGDDAYEFANEEYEQYVYAHFYESVCEVISRFRISLISWYESADKHNEAYGKQWGEFVKRLLHVDYLAKEIGFTETTEEYVKCLISLLRGGNPETFYSSCVGKVLEENVITQIMYLNFRQLTLLTLNDLKKASMDFSFYESQNNKTIGNDFSRKIVQHCVGFGKVDIWFELVMVSYEESRALAFRKIVEQWEDQNEIVDYLTDRVKKDYKNKRSSSHGRYMEELLPIVETEELKIKVYEGLLYTYKLIASSILENSILKKSINIEEERKNIIIKNLDNAMIYRNLPNYDWIEEIKDCLLSIHNIIDEKILQLSSLPSRIYQLGMQEYINWFCICQLNENDMTKSQLSRYYEAEKQNYLCIIDQINSLLDGENRGQISRWLNIIPPGVSVQVVVQDNKDLLTSFLDLYSRLVIYYASTTSNKEIRYLSLGFYSLLESYDSHFREKKIGLYENCTGGGIDNEQKMTSWEKTYAMYCSFFRDAEKIPKDINEVPIVANDFTNKYLQELFDDNEYEAYFALNSKIEKGYSQISIMRSEIVEWLHGYRLIRNYYRWISVRYYRSLDKKDALSSDDLYRRLADEFTFLSDTVSNFGENVNDLIHTKSMLKLFSSLSQEMMYFAKMIPDTIITLDSAKAILINGIETLRKSETNPEEIKELINKIVAGVDDPNKWYNSDMQFIANNIDNTIFELLTDKM